MAMKTEDAKAMYTKFLEKMGKAYDPAKIKGKLLSRLCSETWTLYFKLIDGVFGAMMLVDIANDGMQRKNIGQYTTLMPAMIRSRYIAIRFTQVYIWLMIEQERAKPSIVYTFCTCTTIAQIAAALLLLLSNTRDWI